VTLAPARCGSHGGPRRGHGAVPATGRDAHEPILFGEG